MDNLTPDLKRELLSLLKDHLSIQVIENTTTVDRSYGEYCEKTTFTIQLVLDNEVISEDTVHTYNQ